MTPIDQKSNVYTNSECLSNFELDPIWSMVSGSYFQPSFKSGSQPVLARDLWLPRVPWINVDQAETCWGIWDWHKYLIFDQWESLFINSLKVGVTCTRIGYQGYPRVPGSIWIRPKITEEANFCKRIWSPPFGHHFLCPRKKWESTSTCKGPLVTQGSLDQCGSSWNLLRHLGLT